MIKTKTVEGPTSYRVYNAYCSLVLGLHYMPINTNGQQYDEFLETVEAMPPEDQEKCFRQAARLTNLEKDDLLAMLSFCVDPNGVPYGPVNVKNLNPKMIVEMIVAVCMQIAGMRIDLVSEAEKKN